MIDYLARSPLAFYLTDWFEKAEKFQRAFLLALDIVNMKEPEKKEGWIEVYSGENFNVYDPDLSKIHILDIAHSLSLTCRFNGHCRYFYSTAEHSVLVSYDGGYKEVTEHSDPVGRNQALRKLLHDGGEAYFGDIITPVKLTLPEIHQLEAPLITAIYSRFGLTRGTDEEVEDIHRSDKKVLKTEAAFLVASQGRGWFDYKVSYSEENIINHVPHFIAERMFLERFATLYGIEKTIQEIKDHIAYVESRKLPNSPVDQMRNKLGWIQELQNKGL